MKKSQPLSLYMENGYLNVNEIIEQPQPFIFITGARGIGKTYGFIKWFIDHQIPFIYMRRTKDESDLNGAEESSSITKNIRDAGKIFSAKKIAKKFYQVFADDKEVCLCIGLSVIASVRGISLDQYDYILYDEFITEPHVRALRNEGLAVANAYETFNRNRELEGRPPIKMICLSNSLNIANDVFIQFDLVNTAEQLLYSKEEIYSDSGKMLIICQNSPISARKAGTALYQSASEEYARLAIKNEFILNDFSYVRRMPLAQYQCKLSIGDLFIYKDKDGRSWYCTFTKGQTKKKYGSNHNDLKRMQREQMRLWWAYLDGKIIFDSYQAVALFEKYYDS